MDIVKGKIGNALESVAPDHILGVANDIYDEQRGQYQQDINEAVGNYEDNPEFVKVYLDNEGHILWGIQKDGNIYFGAGVPSQVKEYINSSIASILGTNDVTDKIDSLKEIEAFLEAYKNSDNLQNLLKEIDGKIKAVDEKADSINESKANTTDVENALSEKVDKEDNKSLINSDYAEGVSYEDNPEFIKVELDKEDKIISATKQDGSVYFAAGIDIAGQEINSVIDNPEFIKVWLDSADRILFGIKNDGDVVFGVGIPSALKSYIDNKLENIKDNTLDTETIKSVVAESLVDYVKQETLNEQLEKKIDGEYVDSPEFIQVTTDADGKVLESIRNTGEKVLPNGVDISGKINQDGFVTEVINNPEYLEAKLDDNKKILSYRDKKGVLHEKAGIETPVVATESLQLTEKGMTEFQKALKDAGFQPSSTGDWSDYISNDGDNPLCIPEPRCAMVNISGVDKMPTQKGSEWPCYFEMWDMQGNYFRKKAIIDDQGNTTRFFPKHSFAIDLFDEEWGKDAFSVKIGDWVPRDGYHFKAQYADFFKGISIVAYKVVQEVWKTRDLIYNNPWKKALLSTLNITEGSYDNEGVDNLQLQIDNGAKCIPDGFPCIVYLNGEFYGVFNWALSKSRDNYNLKKDNTEHIHLDGGVSPMRQPLNWTSFEVRNPKYLVYKTPAANGSYEYNADVKQDEIAGLGLGEQADTYSETETYDKGKIVSVDDRLYMSKVDGNIGHNPKDATYKDKPKNVYDKATEWWIEVTFTNKVKQHILSFNILFTNYSIKSKEEQLELLDKNFDIDNLIDYFITQAVFSDEDAAYNWQWFTYDGIKWWIANYDMDRSFGQKYMCYGVAGHTYPSINSYLNNTGYPWYMIARQYADKLKERYNELRKTILTVEHISEHIKNWMDRIGAFNYEREFDKWPESPSNRDSNVNTEYWEVSDSTFKTSSESTYDDEHTYNEGDTCFYGKSVFVEFKCKKESTGNPPVKKFYSTVPYDMGYHDSLWRVITYIKNRLEYLDEQINNYK